MSWELYKVFAVIGLLLNSAIYLIAVLTLAVVFANGLAWRLDLAAIGITYLSYCCHVLSDVPADRWAWSAFVLVWCSIGLGAAAGLVLCFWS